MQSTKILAQCQHLSTLEGSQGVLALGQSTNILAQGAQGAQGAQVPSYERSAYTPKQSIDMLAQGVPPPYFAPEAMIAPVQRVAYSQICADSSGTQGGLVQCGQWNDLGTPTNQYWVTPALGERARILTTPTHTHDLSHPNGPSGLIIPVQFRKSTVVS